MTERTTRVAVSPPTSSSGRPDEQEPELIEAEQDAIRELVGQAR